MVSPLSCVVPEGGFAQVDGPFEGIYGVCADPPVEEGEVEEECEEDDFSHFRPSQDLQFQPNELPCGESMQNSTNYRLLLYPTYRRIEKG